MKSLSLILALVPVWGFAAPYTMEASQGQIRFSGTHAGTGFNGQFKQWQAQIEFDPASLGTSSLSATIVLASANTGNASYDGTLPTADWFNIAQTPVATFTTTSITSTTSPSHYIANGVLTLRGIAKPITLPFSLQPAPAPAPVGAQRAIGTLAIDRLAFGIGQASDPQAAWVGRTISLTIDAVGMPVSKP